MQKFNVGDFMIIVGVILIIIGLRVKIADNFKEKQANIIKQEQAVNKVININTATARQLIDLPSIGEKMAQRIVDYRSSIGKFKSKSQLMNVSGIGAKSYDAIKDKIDL